MKTGRFIIFASNLYHIRTKFVPIIKGFQIFFRFFSKTFHSKFVPIIKSLNKVFKLSLLIRSIKGGFLQIENLPLSFFFKNLDFNKSQKRLTAPGVQISLPALSRDAVFVAL